MSYRTIQELLDLDIAQLEEHARKGDTVLIEQIVFNTIVGDLPLLPGGWALRFVGPKTGLAGKIVLVPKSRYTQQIWNNGQIQFAMAHGLTIDEATAWFESDVRNKHEFLPLLKEVLYDDNKTLRMKYGHTDRKRLISDYLNYSSEFTRSEYLEWQSKSQITEPRHPRRMADFSKLLKHVVKDMQLNEKPLIGGSTVVETNGRPWG